jgi:hypothetical protein
VPGKPPKKAVKSRVQGAILRQREEVLRTEYRQYTQLRKKYKGVDTPRQFEKWLAEELSEEEEPKDIKQWVKNHIS